MPLAETMRPQKIEEVVGQSHLLGENKPLRKILESNREIPNMIFYGPPGTGKTTVASIIAQKTGKRLHKLNGTQISLAEIKQVIGEINTIVAQSGILLYLDEIQYLNKKQQQSLLSYLENGQITLIASTTENPYFYIYNALLSRCTVFEFKPVPTEGVLMAVRRGFRHVEQEQNVRFDVQEEALKHIAAGCGGDVRKAYNTVELCSLSATFEDKVGKITLELAKDLTQKSAHRYDRDGDEHYDLLSALQKSIRGSDPNAAIHYLARLLEAGDMISPARRLLVVAAEDIGLAYPQAIIIVKACIDSAFALGLPEARIPLAQAVILLATSPKSNSAYLAIDQAMSDVRAGKGIGFPRQLQNMHYDGEDRETKGQHYLYPHDFPNHYVKQQYLPDDLEHAQYYQYGKNKTEQMAAQYWEKIKERQGE